MSNTTTAGNGATKTRALSRRSIIAATAGAAIAAAGKVQAAEPPEATMRALITAHRRAHATFRELDRLYDETDIAVRASFEDRPLCLPCTGRTFSAVRSIGAERVIEQRNTPNDFGMYSSLGPCRPGEAERLRRFEAQIREREAEFSWPGLTIAHEIADARETATWNALLDARPVSLKSAALRFEYALKLRPGEGLDGWELERVAKSFLDA